MADRKQWDTLAQAMRDVLTKPAPIRERALHEDQPRQPQIVGQCVVCGGNVVEEIKTRPPHQISEPRIGAPGQPWITYVAGYYCENEECGLSYHHPPGKKQ